MGVAIYSTIKLFLHLILAPKGSSRNEVRDDWVFLFVLAAVPTHLSRITLIASNILKLLYAKRHSAQSDAF